MSRPRPNLDDIFYSDEMFRDLRVQFLSDAAFRALMSLVSACASDMVWTYTEPSNGSLRRIKDVELARICKISSDKWRKVKPEIEPFFHIEGGTWTLRHDWIRINTDFGRPAIPTHVRRAVFDRDGERCAYCGATDGPFDIDHIQPLARGGSNDISNLTVACAPCNRSKGAKTLKEWRGEAV